MILIGSLLLNPFRQAATNSKTGTLIMQNQSLSTLCFFNLRAIAGGALFCAASVVAYFSLAASAMSNTDASSPVKPAAASAVDWRAKVDATVLSNATAGATEFLI